MHTQESGKGMKKLRNNKIRKLLAFMVALALMVSCMPSAYTISASEAFGDGTEDIFTDGEITSEPAAEESTPDVSSADQEETEQAQQSTLTYENDSVKVTAEALEDGALPQNTALKADGVNENSSVSYDTVSQKLSAAATDKGSSLRGFFAYDVYFADGDGSRVEPNGRVRVTFEYKTPAAPELTDAASTSVTVEKLHYNSSTGDTDVNTLQANEDLKVLNVNEGKQIQTLQVETGNAAVFAVMWDSPETADVEAEAVSGNEDEVSIASEELTDGMDISDEPEQDAAETPAAENPEVTPDAEPSEAPAENPDAEPTEAPAEDPDVVEEPAEDIASPDEVPAADENGETSLIKVLGDDTNLRVSPSVEAEVLATVNAGTQLTLLDTVTAEDGATWYKVSWEGTEAYIRSDMAQVVDSSDEAEEVEDVLESEEVSYSQEVDNVVVTATAAKGVIPEGAQFVVTPIEKGSDQYADIEKQLHEGAKNESYTVAGFLAYDISFLNDDGTKIEPQNGSVRVSIAYKEAEIPEDVAETDTAQENMNVSLVHFVEDANGNVTEVVNMSNDGQAEVSTTDNGEIESANFETESFSTFSVVWLADDFTSVQTTSSYEEESTVNSAASGITINMFNYNTAEINEGHSLKFSNGRDGVSDYNKWTESANPYPNIMKKTLGSDSYPALNIAKWWEKENNSSSYLFSTDEGKGKTVYSDANYLFKQDADGYYEYDSAKNFAQFNEQTKKFTVYKVPGSSENAIKLQKDSHNSPHGSFFPFNTLGDSIYDGIHEISENSPDFHFGMTMSAKFIQPKDGKINGNNMVFEFSGDDDVWVYIDGVLVLDIGGIHNAASGSINFADGTVKVGNKDTNLKKLFNDAKIEGDFVSEKNIFKDYTVHTINFYYLERGEGDSNCKLKFNLPTVPKKSVTVEKQLSNTDKEDKEKYANVEFKFQLLLQNDEGEYVPSNTAGTLSDGGEVKFKNNEEINGVSYNNVFTLKPGQKAKFSGLEENTKYKVQELGVSKDRYDRVLINGKETTNESGNVTSSKATVGSRPMVVVTNVLASVAELDFKKVNTKGEALSGAGFTLTSQDDNSKTYTAESGDDGIIKFENLPLGTYTLTETKVPNKYENRNTWIVKVEKDEAGTVVATLYEADGKTVVKKDSKDRYYHIVNYTHQELIESDVEYPKTAHVTDWENRTYKIDISAESKSRSSSTVVTGAADIMLVLDVSDSMSNAIYEKVADNTEEGRSSLESGNTYYLKYNDTYYKITKDSNKYYIYSYFSGWRDISDSQYKNCEIFTKTTRLNALKESVKQFINSTAEKSSNSKIGIATFSWNKHGTTTDLLELENKNNKDTLIETVNGLNADGGTDPDFGLSNAYDKLTAATENGDTLPKYVILFTDGEPTGNSSDSSQGASWSTAAQKRAEATAKKLKKDGVSIYTIGFALSSGSNAERFLAGDGTDGFPGIASNAECAKTAKDAASLSELFRTFEQTILNDVDITNATITDTIDPRFDLLDDAGKIITEKSLTDGTLTLKNGGVVSLVNGNWQVQWTNVTIPNKKKNNPWTKSLNIKAKDTYIGGNDVTTNVREGSNITFGNEKIYLPQPKVNVNAKIFINDKEITIYKGDPIPTKREILDELFKASDVTSYEKGEVGKADIGNIQLKWYKDPECKKPVATDTDGNPVYEQPTADTKYYLKVTYNAGAPSEQSKKNTDNNVAGGEDNIQEAINNNNPYGIYKIHVISGKIDIIKKVKEKSSVDREFQFNVKTEDGDDAFKGKGKTFTLTVSKDSLTGELTDADKKTLENLSRGTYVVSEVNVPDGYKIAGTDIAVETNCQNSVENNETTFVLGNSKQTPNTDVISSEYTYNPNDGGVLGKVSYINEYSVNLDLKKVDSSGNNELSGAEFTLEVKDGTTGQFDGNAYKPFEIDKDTVELKDLKPGLYKLTEIKAPKGYSLLGTSIYFQVKLGKVTLVKEDGTPIEVQPQSMWTLDEDSNVLTIKNTKLYSLPESGGPGTYGFTISGVAILATALLLFINNKRREEEAKRS